MSDRKWYLVCYDVRDPKTETIIGGIYLDLFPRDGKFSHAANFCVRSTSLLEGRSSARESWQSWR